MERKRFKEILKQRGISGRDFASSIGLEYGSYKSSMSRGNCPKWVLAFLMGHDVDVDFQEVLYSGHGIEVCLVDKDEFEVAGVYVNPDDLKNGELPNWKERLEQQKKSDALHD